MTKKQKVLVVEDEDALRTIMFDELQRAGYEVQVAANGEDGLTKAEKSIPDVIILDLMMPKRNGYEMLKALRDSVWGKAIPVVVASNVGSIDSLNQCVAMGANDYIVKTDISIKELIGCVADRIRSSSSLV